MKKSGKIDTAKQ